MEKSDGASGGFLAPFTAPDIVWDFRLPRVKSINASGHKFGLAPLGVGWIVWRDASELPEDLIFEVNYLGGNMPTFALNFSRPGGQVIAQYYNFVRLGREGYQRVHQACYDTAMYLAAEIAKRLKKASDQDRKDAKEDFEANFAAAVGFCFLSFVAALLLWAFGLPFSFSGATGGLGALDGGTVCTKDLEAGIGRAPCE